MNLKGKLCYAFAGFLIGNIILASSIYGIYYLVSYQSSKNEISFDEALQRIKSKEIKEINIKGDKAEFFSNEEKKYSAEVSENQKLGILTDLPDGVTSRLEPASSNPLDRLFQILFILFIISPPIIVVLLLVIISKMNRKNTME